MAGLRRPVLRVDERPKGDERAKTEVADENALVGRRSCFADETTVFGPKLKSFREPLKEIRDPKGRDSQSQKAFAPEARKPRCQSSERPRRDIDVHRSCVGSEAEYADDIFAVALREEKRHRTQQLCDGAITSKMHSVLVDWLAEVHLKFQLRAETLFSAVSLLDRYLAKAEPRRDRLQLVGVTALFVASKYEEVFAPELRDFVYVTDRAYRREEILQCEVEMLTSLQWRIMVPSPMFFLHRFAHLLGLGVTEDKFYLAQYFAELTLPDVRFAKLPPSLIASAALLLANKVVKASPSWPRVVAAALPYQETEVKAAAKQLVELLGADSAVKRKFSSRAFHQVAKLIA